MTQMHAMLWLSLTIGLPAISWLLYRTRCPGY
jgi:hypothetical protein